MRLQVGRRLDDVGRPDHPADPPAGHRVGLRHAVEHDAPVDELGHRDRHGHRLRAVVDQVFVDLVGDHPDVVLDRPPADRLGQLPGGHRPRRVRRRAPQQHLRPLGARLLELLDRRQELGLGPAHHLHGDPAGEADRLRVGRPVRRGQQDLVARVEQGGEGLVDGLLAAVGDQHLAGGNGQAGVAPGLRRDRVAQLGKARGRGVAVVARVEAGLLCRGDDRGRGREVRLAGAEPDDGAAGGLERLGLGVDGQSGGLGDAPDPGGDAGADCGGGGCAGHVGILPHRHPAPGPGTPPDGRGSPVREGPIGRPQAVPYTRRAGYAGSSGVPAPHGGHAAAEPV